MAEKLDLEKFGSLWKNESESGFKYMSGTVEIDGTRYRVKLFPNRFKKEDKHPDYNLMIIKDDFDVLLDRLSGSDEVSSAIPAKSRQTRKDWDDSDDDDWL